MKSGLGEVLAKRGIIRDIGMTISGHLAVPVIIAGSNLIASVTRELAEPYVEKYGPQILKLPFDIPDIQLSLFWHERNDRDAGHQWLREMTVRMTKRFKNECFGIGAEGAVLAANPEGLPPHGLRKPAAVRLAEDGLLITKSWQYPGGVL